MCGHTGPYAPKGPVFGLMLCCCHPEILKTLEQGTPHFNFALGSPPIMYLVLDTRMHIAYQEYAYNGLVSMTQGHWNADRMSC